MNQAGNPRIFIDAAAERLDAQSVRICWESAHDAEVAGAPDRLPGDGSAVHIHLPVNHGRFDFAEAMQRLKTENYGTARNYLIKKAGLSPGELSCLEQNLLV